MGTQLYIVRRAYRKRFKLSFNRNQECKSRFGYTICPV